MKKRIQKVLATLMALTLCLGMLPTTAFAASNKDTQEDKQIPADGKGGTVYYLADGTAGTSSEDYEVMLSKTISPTGIENVFDIELAVKTTEDLSKQENESAPNASVVLIVDVSSTMYQYCSNCGVKGCTTHKVSATDINSNYYTGGTKIYERRATMAVKEIKNFLDTFEASAGNSSAERNVAIVLFQTNTWGYTDWTNINSGNNLNAMKDQVDRILTLAHGNDNYSGVIKGGTSSDKSEKVNDWPEGYHRGGTNIEGGLLVAKNFLNNTPDPSTPTAKDKTYAIMLSDGQPTISQLDSSESYSGTYFLLGNDDGTGTTTNAADYNDVADQANEVMELSDKFYTISMGDKGWTSTKMGGKTVATWLNAWSDVVVDGTDTDTLHTAFGAIAEEIGSTVSYASSEAWSATDAMNANVQNAYIEFLGFYDKDKTYNEENPAQFLNGSYAEGAEDTAEFKDDAISWSLKASGYDKSGDTYTYGVKYRVRLKNEAGSFVEGTTYDTNHNAQLKYQTQTDTGFSAIKTAAFPVPFVNGYLGDFSFVKQDADNADMKLGDVQFTLSHACSDACGVSISDEKVLSSKTTGEVKFSDIPSGHTYTLRETSTPGGYAENNKESTITVTYGEVSESGDLVTGTSSAPIVKNEREKVKLTVEKIWSGTTGDNVVTKFDVYNAVSGVKSGNKLETVTITGADSVETTNSYPKYDEGGNLLEYIVEEQADDSYEQKGAVVVTRDGDGFGYKFAFTNILTDETELTIKKVWNAPENIQKSVKVALYRDSESTDKTLVDTYTISGSSWEKTVKELPVYDESGYTYTYSVVEVDEAGTEITSYTEDGHDIQVSVNGTTVTNAVVQKKTSVSGTKTWKNGETYSDEVVVGLFANDALKETQTTSGLSYAFNDLDVYGADGEVITYTVKEMDGENDLAAGETFAIGEDTYEVSYNGTNIINTRVGEVDITVEKVWADDDDELGLRPDSITLNLMNGAIVVDSVELEPEEIVTEEGQPDDPATEENEFVARESHFEWTEESLQHKFSSLPMYDANGVEIEYTVVEVGTQEGSLPTSVADSWYIVTDGNAANDYTVTNTLDGTARNITVTKSWNDALSAENRTATATVTLYADGIACDSVTFPKEDGSNTHTFEDLDVYDATGKVITYTAEETSVPTGYTSSKSGDFTFTNTIDQEELDISVTKEWKGGSESARPSITVNLLANGEEVAEIQLPVVDATTGVPAWSYTFENQPKYAYDDETNEASVISYTVTEEIENTSLGSCYTGAVTGNVVDGFTVTNTFDAGSTSVEGTKTWIAGGYEEEVVVGLYANGVLKEVQTTSELSYKFENLNAYSSTGNRINYSVKEMVSDGNGGWVDTGSTYTAANGKTYNVTYAGNSIVNSVPQGSAGVPVEKVWNGPAPKEENITFTVKRSSNGVEDANWSATVTLPTVDGAWADALSDLPSVDADGYAYTYTVTEDRVDADGFIEVEGIIYKSTVDSTGRVFTNTVQDPNNGTLTVNKVWAGDGYEAEEIKVQLLADGVAVEGKVLALNAENNWTGTFVELPLYNASTYANILYSVKEVGEANGRISLNNGSNRYSVSYDSSVPNVVTVTNTLADSDAYMYRINRYYTAKINGTLIDEGTDHDEAWTISYKDEPLNIDAGKWTSFNGNTYSFQAGDVDWYNVGEDFANFTIDGNTVTFTVEKYSDGDNCYVVDLHYYREKTTGGGGGGDRIPPVIIIPDEEVPLVPVDPTPVPETPVEEILPEDVPLADPPKTGDISSLWLTLSALSGAGLAGVTLLGRKKREEE